MIKNNFSANLKYLRNEHNVGQVELAAAIGVSKGCISLWENGLREPSLSLVIAVANYFHLSLDELVNQSDM